MFNVKVDVRRIGTEPRPVILRSNMFSELNGLPIAEAFERIVADSPIDGVEIVEWMHDAVYDVLFLDTFSNAAEANGGEIAFATGDGNIPGVKVDRDFYVRRERGYMVSRKGYASVIVRGVEVKVPAPGKKTIILRDFLGWAAVPKVFRIQFVADLLKCIKLPRAPVRDLPFPLTRACLKASVFVYARTRIPSPVVTMRLRLTSAEGETITMRVRSPSDYRVVWAEREMDVYDGVSEATVTMLSLTPITSFVIELEPEDNCGETLLEKLEVYP